MCFIEIFQYMFSEVAMESTIQAALKKADVQGVRGKAVTPFVLQCLAELTSGKSLQTSILSKFHSIQDSVSVLWIYVGSGLAIVASKFCL